MSREFVDECWILSTCKLDPALPSCEFLQEEKHEVGALAVEEGAILSLLEGRRVLQVENNLTSWNGMNKQDGGKVGVV